MSQRQQYAIVPVRATDDMILAADELNDTFAPVSVVYDTLVKAAPPPPESVLSDEDIRQIIGDDFPYGSYGDCHRLASRIQHAVLTRLTEPK